MYFIPLTYKNMSCEKIYIVFLIHSPNMTHILKGFVRLAHYFNITFYIVPVVENACTGYKET